MRLLKLIPEDTNIGFVRLRYWAFGITGLLTLLGVAAVGVRGLNLGVDFVGGLMIEARFQQPPPLEQLRANVDRLGVGQGSLQQYGDPRTVAIRLPLPSTVITIRDDDGKVLPIGETGEICIAGPQVMKGYWNRPDETEKVMNPDGSFRTGDIGLMTAEGYVKLVDHFNPVGMCNNGVHTMDSTAPFGVYVWGWGSEDTNTGWVSYGYPAGKGVLPINDVVIQ